MDSVVLSGVSKSYNGRFILKDVNLSVDKGDFITVFGPNGSGKSTLLNIIAGIIKPDKGKILIEGRPSKEQIIGYAFQNYRDSLLPWRTNLENIGFPLEIKGVSKLKIENEVKKFLKRLNVRLPLDKYPYQSSGGEQQLVAILREVISCPKIILMDEPFSAIDMEGRAYIRIKIQEIWCEMGIAIIFVTHDISEAIQLGSKLLIIDGKTLGIKETVSINFKRPRTEDLLLSSSFVKFRKNLIWKMRN
ncbi:ABC transporter ATP-binding protein [Candidatus Woesearchaeota archaeon]|nr:ABC transporter ATP-binding protein [Candidatus Woesearchaeota archaeon]